MSRAPEVSVVIPTRDRWPLLALALDGALRQEQVALEIIVIDDGSADETYGRMNELGDERVRVVRHDATRGVAQARNAGISRARGAWLAFLDDDDLWSPRKLRTQLDAASAVGADFAYSSVVLLDEARNVVDLAPAPAADGLLASLLERNVIWGGASSVVAKTSLVRALGGFDEALSHLTDWDLWIRLADAGGAAASPEALVGYVQHPGSMVITDWRGVAAEIEHVTATHKELAAREGVDVDVAAFARWIAIGHGRGGRRLSAAREYARAALIEARQRNLAAARSSLRASVGAVARPVPPGGRRRTGGGRPVPAPAWLASYGPGLTPGQPR